MNFINSSKNCLCSPVLFPLLVMAFIGSIICLPLTADETPAGFMSIKGSSFIDPAGKVFLPRGINLGNWLVPEGYLLRIGETNSPRTINEVFSQMVGESEARDFWNSFRDNFITRDDIQCIKKAGFNSIRIPFDYRLFVNEAKITDGLPTMEGPGYALLDRAIGWCREANIYVVLDMHAAPGGQTGFNIDNSWGYPFLYESRSSQLLTAKVWQTLAQRYCAEPTVWGYDLLNEPIADFFDAKKLNPHLEPVYKEIVTAIRSVDKHHIIFLGGAQWNTNFAVFGPPFDSRLAYTFHLYLMDPTQAVIQPYLDFRNKYKVPMWLGESGETGNEWNSRFTTLLEKNGIGWCFWPYKKMEVTTDHGKVHPYGSCVATITPPEGWEKVSAFAALPRDRWEDLRKNKPSLEASRELLRSLLVNIQLKNCHINHGYLKSLGLDAQLPDQNLPRAVISGTTVP